MPLEVRSATLEDLGAISTMQKASLPETYGPFLGRATVEEFVTSGKVERDFEEHWRTRRSPLSTTKSSVSPFS
jgi:hypothetical protein